MPKARSGSSPECGFVFVASDETEHACRDSGKHFCRPRALKVDAFFREVLVHTKGIWARRPFELRGWQRKDIIWPLFGEAVFDAQWDRYVRRYRLGWVELGRGQGKSELDAGVALYLEMGDDEESAEVYGAAKDAPQARKVWDVADRMVRLSPVLGPMRKAGQIKVNRQEKRIIYEPTGSYYEVITSDAAGELGQNPHGIIFDEVLTQKDRALWDALRTGMGKRVSPLMLATTTAGDDPESFAAEEHNFCLRVAEDPTVSPRRFVYIRNTPADADPWKEKTWYIANPALGDFLSIETLRDEAAEAKADPLKEVSFRQFRLNQWVQKVTRLIPLPAWDACGLSEGPSTMEERLIGQRCWGGLDLAATSDLAALAWFFDGEPHPALFRFWVPQAKLRLLDSYLGGKATKWVREGLLVATEGEVIDYDAIHAKIATDAERFDVVSLGIDRWNSTGTTNWLEAEGIPHALVGQGFAGMSAGTKSLLRLITGRLIDHAGHPVARWNAESVEGKRDDADNVKPVKPDRQRSGKRIDGIVALVMAVDGWLREPEEADGGFVLLDLEGS